MDVGEELVMDGWVEDVGGCGYIGYEFEVIGGCVRGIVFLKLVLCEWEGWGNC